MKRTRRGPTHNDRGASLILALAVMLAVGGIMSGLITFLETSFKTSLSLEVSRNRQYAADAGVEQAIRFVQDDTTNRALLGTYCKSGPPGPFVPAAPINGYNVRVDCQGAPSAILDSLNRTVIERNVIFLACVAPAPTAAPACTNTNAVIKAKVNFPTNAAGAVSGAFVQSWSVN